MTHLPHPEPHPGPHPGPRSGTRPGADRVVLAVDAGGTSTRALVADLDGTVLGAGRSGSGNPTSAGPAAALVSLRHAAGSALTTAGRSGGDVVAGVVAMAGQARLLSLADLVTDLGLGAARVEAVSDVLAMYRSGAVEDDGCAVVAGTGSVAAQVVGGELHRVVGGSGWLLGDPGSGFATGLRVARAAVADLDGSGPATALTDAVLAVHSLRRDDRRRTGRPAVLEDLVTAVYGARPVAVAALAPLAFAARDDEVARGVVDAAHDELAALVGAVRRQPDGTTAPGPVVMGGTLLERAVLTDPGRWTSSLLRALEGTDVRRARDGAAGAALLALRAAGVEVLPEHLARLGAGAAAAVEPAP